MHESWQLEDRANSGELLATLKAELTALTMRVAQLEASRSPDTSTSGPARRAEVATQLETKLGTYWLSRVGIVSLISGTALLILTYFAALGPVLRVALGYAIAAAVAWTGRRLSRRHALFGDVVFGGGLAIAYFVTYALHFVPAMQIIASEPLGVLFVAAAIGAIVIIAHRMKSETVAGIALFLGLHTGMLTDVTVLTLVCTTMLAAGAVFFLAANRWVIVPLSSVVAVYATHASWAFSRSGHEARPSLSLAFLSIDFIVFASASLLRPDARLRSLVALSLLNWLGMIALGSYELRELSVDTLFGFLCGFAAAHAGLAVLAWLRSAPRVFVALQIALAIITLALALPVRVDGWTLLSAWVVLALTAAATARRASSSAFGWVALVILVFIQAHVQLRELGAAAQLVCALACVATERIVPRTWPASDRVPVPRILFVAGVTVALLACAIDALSPGYQSLGWVAAAFLLFVLGFALRSGAYRGSAFVVLGLSAVRVLAVDLRDLSANQRILTFVVAGVLLLIVSFTYSRTRAPPTDAS